VARIAHLFATRLGQRAVAWVQNPLALDAHQSQPLPDVALLVPRPDFYAGGFPEAASVRLLVEVADDSLHYDRGKKLPLYSRAGVAEAWLANVETQRLEIHRNPARLRYRSVRLPTADETFAPAAFPDVKLRLKDLFG
jgi:Uma2 family endonuclease